MSEEARGTPAADRDSAETRRIVRERYARIATGGDGSRGDEGSCCGDADDGGGSRGSCCDDVDDGGDADGSCCDDAGTGSQQLGYDAEDLAAVADGADLGLGCGNPKAFAEMSPGETVLDLGSGAGFDCFLAAREVGEEGHVIGVDMTPEMVETARENAANGDVSNVEFRLGEIAHLPVADETVDVAISNCVVNLAPEKRPVFADAYRVLAPGGRLAISDVVRTAPFPGDVRMDPDSLTGCVAGASTVGELEAILDEVGFEAVEIAPKAESAEFIREWDAERDLSEYLVSARIEARKPATE